MESLGKLIIILIASVFGSFGIQFILSYVDGRYKKVKHISKKWVLQNSEVSQSIGMSKKEGSKHS